MTNKPQHGLKLLLAASMFASSTTYAQFDSGSTGEDGAFSPLVDTTLQLPEDGILNYTTVTIPTGVTVRFERNATNTPVVVLATGNVTIDGEINVSGSNGIDTGAKGDGSLGDDGLPGSGGPGGFDGGSGGTVNDLIGGNGLGPGGAAGGIRTASAFSRPTIGCPGNSAAYGANGRSQNSCVSPPLALSYGNTELQPLIGGSGGGGGYSGVALGAGGGGGGGGAILIASNETITVNGRILANGGGGGDVAGADSGGAGGAGSGGAIRLVATTIDGNGAITANGGPNVGNDVLNIGGGAGAIGRIRLEAENFTRTAGTTPSSILVGPEPIFLANIPGVRITSVAGIVTPASPTGAGDVIIPEATPNPVAIAFSTTNVPVGNTIELTLTPQTGASTVVVSTAITGTEASGTANVSVDIPDGPSTLSASVTFTVAVASNGEAAQDYSQFAQGNTVEKIRVDFDPIKGSLTTFIADNGQEFTWPSNAVAFN